MLWFPTPSKPPTSFDYAVIAIGLAVLLILFGVADFVVAYRLPPLKHDAAVTLHRLGFWSLGLGYGIITLIWLIRRFQD